VKVVLSASRIGWPSSVPQMLQIRQLKAERHPGFNFTDVLHEAFMLVDPESVKKYS